jgi:hypothetical protein
MTRALRPLRQVPFNRTQFDQIPLLVVDEKIWNFGREATFGWSKVGLLTGKEEGNT